jgi:hypothetical protein
MCQLYVLAIRSTAVTAHIVWALTLNKLCILSTVQIQRSGFDSRRYQIFSEVVGLERGPLSLLSTINELLERKCSAYDLESWH